MDRVQKLLVLLLPLLVYSSSRSCESFLSLLNKTEEKVYSQSWQDGILKEIFKEIGTTNKFFAEFGFGYTGGKEIHSEEDMDHAASGLNTRLLSKNGWTGVYFDAVIENKQFNIVKATLTLDNIVEVFTQAKVPKDADYISIDVDSVDIWLLLGLLKENHFRPRVISMEYNANLGRTMITHQSTWHQWEGDTVYGTSVGAIDFLARLFGYTTVHVMPKMLDVFLIRNDVLSGVCDLKTVPPLEDLTPFLPSRVHPTCSVNNLHRLVDFPLAVIGDMKEAHHKAVRELRHLDEHYFRSNTKGSICNYS